METTEIMIFMQRELFALNTLPLLLFAKSLTVMLLAFKFHSSHTFFLHGETEKFSAPLFTFFYRCYFSLHNPSGRLGNFAFGFFVLVFPQYPGMHLTKKLKFVSPA